MPVGRDGRHRGRVGGLTLPRALVAPDVVGTIVQATVTQVAADGTVVVDFGGRRVSGASLCVSGYSPVVGDIVQVQRRDASSFLVLGTTRTANTAAQSQLVVRTPYNVLPSISGVPNPLVVSVAATGSWRSADGWGSSYMPTTDTVAQGAYSASSTYYEGCYFYGAGAFASLAGRRCTGLTIRIHRLGVGGTSAATQQVLSLHVHPTAPTTPPAFLTSYVANVGSLAWNGIGTYSLPTAWGDLLIAGKAAGVGHLLLAWGQGNQSYAAGKAADTATGQLSITWA